MILKHKTMSDVRKRAEHTYTHTYKTTTTTKRHTRRQACHYRASRWPTHPACSSLEVPVSVGRWATHTLASIHCSRNHRQFNVENKHYDQYTPDAMNSYIESQRSVRVLFV